MTERDHEFVITNGIEIDTKMVDLIEALWSLGFKTEACCENINQGLSFGLPAAQVLFARTSDAMDFMEVTCEKLFGHGLGCSGCGEAWAGARLSMHPMMPSLNGLRWSVEFSPEYIDRITEIWTPVAEESFRKRVAEGPPVAVFNSEDGTITRLDTQDRV